MNAPDKPPGKTRRAARPEVTRRLAVLREGRAIDLRLRGFSYAEIAGSLLPCSHHQDTGGDRECGLCQVMYPGGPAGAQKAVERALVERYASDAGAREQLRAHQLGQIDLLLRRSIRSAMQGDWEAMRSAVRLLDRRARLLGLDAPRRHIVTTELDEAIGELLDDLERQEAAKAPAPKRTQKR